MSGFTKEQIKEMYAQGLVNVFLEGFAMFDESLVKMILVNPKLEELVKEKYKESEEEFDMYVSGYIAGITGQPFSKTLLPYLTSDDNDFLDDKDSIIKRAVEILKENYA